ncbi:hypothetical protein JCM21900_006632 [Sporobolomyces salmonicolor]
MSTLFESNAAYGFPAPPDLFPSFPSEPNYSTCASTAPRVSSDLTEQRELSPSSAPAAEKPSSAIPDPPVKPKSIAIIGGGTGGLGALIGILDLPEEVRQGWTIDLFERRKDIGGVWLPDPKPSQGKGKLPETPLYPALHTNTPVPTMTFPGLPFPPHTPLFPSHTHIESYLRSSLAHFALRPHLRLSHDVTGADYSPSRGKWALEVQHKGEREKKEYEHLVIAAGRYHYPKVPVWQGQGEWLEAGKNAGDGRPEREIVHSLWYRGAEALRGRTVVVVGFGASGWDIASQCVGVADEVYHSYTADPSAPVAFPPVRGTIQKPRISHFTPSSVVFVDGSVVATGPASKFTVVLATGYELQIPFLSPSLLSTGSIPPSRSRTTPLSTNGIYLRPLYHDLFPISSPSLPSHALALIGLPWFVAAGQCSYIQGLVAGHAFAAAEDGVLGGEAEQWRELEGKEATRRKDEGLEPFEVGHKFTLPGQAEDYQNALLALLRARSPLALPAHLGPSSQPFVPAWRRWARSKEVFLRLRRGFERAQKEGTEEEFRAKEGSEEEWVTVMERLEAWERGREEEEGEWERGGRVRVRRGEETETGEITGPASV